MMYPETFANNDKDVLNAYQQEYEKYHQDQTDGLQGSCCLNERSQFCPKCGYYHKGNSFKRCLCLTLTSMMACICFLFLTLWVSLQVNDMQNGYEVVHHFLILVTNTGSNDALQANYSSEGQNHSIMYEDGTSTTEIPFSTSLYDTNENNENYLDDTNTNYEDYLDDKTENDENYSNNERLKRSVISFMDQNNGNSTGERFDCISFLSRYSNTSSNSEVDSKGGFVTGESEHSKRYKYCKSLIPNIGNKTVSGNSSIPNQLLGRTEVDTKGNLKAPLKKSENSLIVQSSEKTEEKYFEKRSYGFDYTPQDQYPYYELDARKPHLHGEPDLIPLNRDSDQNVPLITSNARTSHPYPPTGPGESNYAESVKTSQQLTVANNNIWKPVCFRAQNSPNPSSLVCLPMGSRQFEPNQALYYNANSDSFGKKCGNGNCGRKPASFDPPLPTIITPSTVPSDLNSDLSRNQPLLISATNPPSIHVPTAISSPNPYFFPTFNGAPIMTQLPYDSHQIPSYFSPTWPYRGSPPGFPQFPSPHFYETHGSVNSYIKFSPQPQFNILQPQSPADLQNPVICMYVPSQSHQFPVVNGVMEVKNRNVDEASQSTSQSTNQSSLETFRSGIKDCRSDEFACIHSDQCIPLTNWCDGRVECSDASDETDCSCKHRINKQRLCDGYFDCPSGEDELGCFGCGLDTFSCQDWERGRGQSTCIPLSKRCDNVLDCINHRDEMECALLSESIVPHKTQFVSYTNGILHRNWQGRWYPACTGPRVTEWAIQACLADAGPLTGDPHVEMVSTEYPGPFIIPNGPEKYSLSLMCRDQKVVTYIRCPPVHCGTRVARSLLDSSVKAREIRPQPMSSGPLNKEGDFKYMKSEEYFGLRARNQNEKNIFDDHLGNAQHKDGYCETCNLGAKHDLSSLIASKSKEYQTEFEPVEEEDHRWTRDPDDILGVVGGRRSRPTSWPWLVALYQDGKFHCGGVIVNEYWVLTAAHCVDQFPKHYLEVQAGMLRRFSFSPQEQTRRVSHVVLHSLYNMMDMQNDLALLRLHSKLKYNRWVRPICLPQEAQYGPPPGSLCTTVGWGANEEGGVDPDDLHEVNVPILPYCKHRADQEGAGLCAGYLRGGHDACQGDSGGPLLCKIPGDEDHWYVAGVVSHGEGCARPDEPGVYTRIFIFLDWINSIVSDNGDSLSADQMPRTECPGQQCSSDRRCVALSQLCDTKVDCLNAEDETFCNQNNLGKSLFSPRHSTTDDKATCKNSSSCETNNLTEESDKGITIHEILREPEEYLKYKNDGNDIQDTYFEEGPINIKFNFKSPESKPTLEASNENKNETLPITEDQRHHLMSEEENEHCTEVVDEDDKGNTEKKLNFKPPDSKPTLETSNEDKNKTLPITEDPRHHLISEEENEYYTEVVDEEDKGNVENSESSDKRVLPNSQESQPVLENYTTTESSEDNEMGLSTYKTDELSTTPSNGFENSVTLSTVSSLSNENRHAYENFSDYYKEDTQLVNELILEDKNSSDSDDSKTYYINIPPYLLPIIFPNGTGNSHTKNSSVDELNHKSNTSNKEFETVGDRKNVSSYASYAFENNTNIETNKKEQESSFGIKGESITHKNFSVIELINNSSTSNKNNPNSNSFTDFATLPPNNTKTKNGFKQSSSNHGEIVKDIMKEVKGNEKEVYESFCKNFMSHSESTSGQKEKTSKMNSNPNESVKEIGIHELDHLNQKDILNLSHKNKEMSNNTSKQVKRAKLYICKRYKQPLLRRRRCDGFIDCEDGSDEEKCSCKERLMALDSSLTCDGEVHCYDQTDERHCKSKCNNTEYFCSRSKICIPQASRCDGKRDCPRNDDEENCYALLTDGEVRLDRAQVPEFSQEGIIATNSVRGWRALCVGAEKGHTAATRACIALGFKGYEKFVVEMVKNESSKLCHSPGVKENTSLCSGLRVKCLSNNLEKFWIGWLLVEGVFNASVALIHPQWFLTHLSVCKQLNLETQHAEISIGRNRLSDLGIRGVYEEIRRIDDIILFENSSSCLLHAEIPLGFSRRVRPINLQFSNQADSRREFYAVTFSGRGFHKLKLNESRRSFKDDELCFTISHHPSQCYTQDGLSENGFIIMTTLFDSFVTSTFDSYKIFCDSFTEICLKKLSTFSSLLLEVLEKGQVSSKASPQCDGVRCGKCVLWANVSDGEPDCYDQSDETSKAFYKRLKACQMNHSFCGCRQDELRCPDGQCIDKSLYCDGVNHCEDGSDEPHGCKDSCFKYLQFAYPHKICDGVRNCFDKSDEQWEICHNKTCTLKNSYICRSNGKCIPQEFVCDNEADCPDGDDEKNCVSILRSKLTEGMLSQKNFGVWTPKCLNNSTSDFSSICIEMEMSKAITREVTSPNSTNIAADSFSPVRLNNMTTIVIRKGRPLLEADSSVPCKYLYIKCL